MNYNPRNLMGLFRPPIPPCAKVMPFRRDINGWSRPPALLSENLLLPSSHQPPPMFGPRGATIPPRFYNSKIRTHDDMNNHADNYWCETCDRGFKSSLFLENHKKEHQKCNIDGCQFIAHPKVITKHIQMQHSSGLYQKISKLNDPEEIKKWREERRKKFPTRENILQQQAAIKEKIERGEKMGLKKEKRSGNPHHASNLSQIRKKSVIRRRPKKIEKECPATKPKHSLPAFGGISQLMMETDKNEEDISNCTNFDIEDEVDIVFSNQNQHVEEKNLVCGAINKLIADYGSSEEDENLVFFEDLNIKQKDKLSLKDATSAMKKHNDETIKPDKVTVLRVHPVENNSDDSGPEEVKTVKTKNEISFNSNIAPEQINDEKAQKTLLKPPRKPMQKHFTRKLPSTLLEKLLSKEIRHERNVILQCVRHIVKNNYFDT